MKNAIYIIILLSNNLIAQDSLRQEICELFWDGEIEIFVNPDVELSFEEQVNEIQNQGIATNCYSNFYRYVQNIQQPSGERIIYYPFENYELQEEDKIYKNLVEIKDQDTGEIKNSTKFSFKSSYELNHLESQESIEIQDLFGVQLTISNLFFQDSLNQLLDECHKKYSLTIFENGLFKQGYENETNCHSEISNEQFKKIQHWGFAKFKNANHFLWGSEGQWKLVDQRIYLKFNNGNIADYDLVYKEKKLYLSKLLTTIEFTKTDR